MADGTAVPPRADQNPFTAQEEVLLRGVGTSRDWLSGEVIFLEGGTPDSVVLIREGLVKATSHARSGYISLLAVRGPGQLVGELACLDRMPRSATVTTLQSVKGTVITADRFTELLRQNGALALSLIRSITSRLRDADRLRADQGALPANDRVARVLLDLALRHGTANRHAPYARTLAVSQADLASASGTSRESAVRALRLLQGGDVVSTSRGRITVHDVRNLSRWING
ncbi:Crp/Fnr family transcriptional regulator [Streptomyces microflavus]|uniref:Crp/Fnr family transcriptional regulator n=1 Tax=Streptomyces microflavus TaxID=1919 RepID=UPI003454D420